MPRSFSPAVRSIAGIHRAGHAHQNRQIGNQSAVRFAGYFIRRHHVLLLDTRTASSGFPADGVRPVARAPSRRDISVKSFSIRDSPRRRFQIPGKHVDFHFRMLATLDGRLKSRRNIDRRANFLVGNQIHVVRQPSARRADSSPAFSRATTSGESSPPRIMIREGCRLSFADQFRRTCTQSQPPAPETATAESRSTKSACAGRAALPSAPCDTRCRCFAPSDIVSGPPAERVVWRDDLHENLLQVLLAVSSRAVAPACLRPAACRPG